MPEPIDIPPADLKTIQEILNRHVPECEVRAFGSRVTWMAKEYSDLDLAIMTDTPLTTSRIADLREAFTESSLSIKVDLIDWAAISEKFRKIIEKKYEVVQIKKTSIDDQEWIECKIKDVCSSIDYGLTASASKFDIGPRFLRITDISNGSINWSKVPHVDIDEDEKRKYRLNDGDIVIARTGASTGESAYIQNPPEAVFASYLIRLKTKPEFDSRFLAYYMKSNKFWSFIRGVLGDKSAQPNASASTMTDAPFKAPKSKEKQTSIAHVLGKLDEKININRKTNETLEAMARALFKSWFIDFEPVCAKSKSRDTGLPKEIVDLFPSKFQNSELGEIPKGWTALPFIDTLEITGGGTPKTSVSEYWDGNIPWFSVADAPNANDVWVIDTEKKITQAGVEACSTRLLEIGTTIITARGTVGKVALIGVPMTMNQSCYGLRGKNDKYGFFTYFLTRHLISELQMHAHGSVFDTITRDTFAGLMVVVPPANIVEAFNDKLYPILSHIRIGLEEIRTLAIQRDTLLPNLISGKIRMGVSN